MTSGPTLDRRLGLGDAVAIGLGSMLGAGIFAALAPAARAAGTALLIGLVIAGIVAWCNATSSAQLAAQYPESGGTYVYGRRELGEWPGFIAGWCFVVGKTASCAAMALTVAAYAAPDAWAKPAAVLAVALITLVNCLGVSRTATATKVIVVAVIAVLAVVVVAGMASGTAARPGGIGGASPYEILQSAGILFFAFAGYARIATMGEEVRAPKRTIPRAIVIALVLALVIYLVIAVTALTTIGPAALASSTAPLADVAAAGGWAWTAPVVRAGAVLAALGALLALMAGITRTALAMARGNDLPAVLGRISAGARVPRVAAIVLGALVAALVLAVDLRAAIGFSSFGVLLYYLVANLSAFHQAGEYRRYPRYVQVLGAAGCVVLAATLPRTSILGAGVAVAIGIAYRAIRRARARRDAELLSP